MYKINRSQFKRRIKTMKYNMEYNGPDYKMLTKKYST